MTPDRAIILASSSISRRGQLTRLGIDFDVAEPNIDETPLTNEQPTPLVLRLSEAKARKIAPNFPNSLIIAGDQTAMLNGEFLTKPGTRDNAIRQLSGLSGRKITFVSGLCVLDTQSGHIEITAVECFVKFRELSTQQIENYITRDEPLQAAGSFKAESAGIALFEYLRSDDPSAITGMPLIALVSLLNAQGYRLFT